MWYKVKMEDAIQSLEGIIDLETKSYRFDSPIPYKPDVIGGRRYVADSGYILLKDDHNINLIPSSE